MNTIRVSNSLDSDQDRQSVSPDLCPNCFAKVISRRQKSLLVDTDQKKIQLEYHIIVGYAIQSLRPGSKLFA